MRLEDVRICVRHGVDIAGFVVDYPKPVPWNLSVQSAKELISAASGSVETCVVTGGPPDKILSLIAETHPDYVQLHSGETLADTLRLAGELGKSSVKIIKALFPDTPDLEKTAVDFCEAGVFALLFDPRTPDNAAHGGEADIAAYRRLQSAVSCPVILAGGLTPENVAELVLKTGAPIIDLMTGVETRPGAKDEAKVIALFEAVEKCAKL